MSQLVGLPVELGIAPLSLFVAQGNRLRGTGRLRGYQRSEGGGGIVGQGIIVPVGEQLVLFGLAQRVSGLVMTCSTNALKCRPICSMVAASNRSVLYSSSPLYPWSVSSR